jgi:cytosine/creatinine deaminase
MDTELCERMMAVALEEARRGLAEGGIPIGAALFTRSGELVSRGHNRRVQLGDPSIHGETDAFRRAGRQKSYRDLVMVTTLAPCWYCSGLVRQFRIGAVVVGESRTFAGGVEWLRANGVEVIDLDSRDCRELLEGYIRAHPAVWKEDIGEEQETYSASAMSFDSENVRRAFSWRKIPEFVMSAGPTAQISSSDEEDAQRLLSRDWRDLTWDDWDEIFRGLFYITHEEVAYYMPSIMLLSMEEHNQPMLAVGSLLMMLSKGVTCEGSGNDANEDLLRLTNEECGVLAGWLQYLCSRPEYETGSSRVRIEEILASLRP